jgi:hypothetical protein
MGLNMKTRKGKKKRSLRVRASGGFTLIEVQVAALIGAISLMAVLDYARVQGELISWIQESRNADGYVDVSGARAILVSTDAGMDAAAPVCEIRLTSIDTSGTYPLAEVVVRQRGF